LEANLYRYINNNPIISTDPEGLPLPLIIGGGVAIGGVLVGVGVLALGVTAAILLKQKCLRKYAECLLVDAPRWAGANAALENIKCLAFARNLQLQAGFGFVNCYIKSRGQYEKYCDSQYWICVLSLSIKGFAFAGVWRIPFGVDCTEFCGIRGPANVC
jgi:hypothetical protein